MALLVKESSGMIVNEYVVFTSLIMYSSETIDTSLRVPACAVK
jgi:hypothetical protein